MSPSKVRLKPSGASERLRRPQDDINYTTRPGAKCTVCGRHARVPDGGRSKLCEACATDRRIVARATAALEAAGQPPLGAAVPEGSPLHKLRTRGLEAKARLDRRHQKSKAKAASVVQPKPASHTARAKSARVPRRLTAADKRTGVRRLQERIRSIERQLKHPESLRPHARARFEEELMAAKRLLRRWDATD